METTGRMRKVGRRAAAALAGVVAIGVVAGLGVPEAEAASEAAYIVRFVAGVDPQVAAESLRSTGVSVDRVFDDVFGGAAVRLPSDRVFDLYQNLNVVSVESDNVMAGALSQSSPPWGLDRSDQRTKTLSRSYVYPMAATGITAYVVDSGIRPDHADLTGRVRSGMTTVADGRGTNDCVGHGTHVAGIIGGTKYGLAKSSSLVSVRVLDCSNGTTESALIAGLDWVVNDHAAGVPAVANVSITGPASPSVDAAIQAVINDGVSVFVAAGNSNADACNYSPARVPAAFTVGATDSTDTRASFSNYGSCVDLFAPGVSITSAGIASTSASLVQSGTSMAAPHATGAAMVLLAQRKTLDPAGVASVLLADATPSVVVNAGTGSPNKLLYSWPTARTTPSAPARPSATAGSQKVTLKWTLGANGGVALTSQTVHIYKAGVKIGTLAVGATATTATVTGLQAGVGHYFTVTATNPIGTSPESAKSTTVTPTA